MTTTDWIIDITLIAIVLRQIREDRLDWKLLAVPLVLVTWTGFSYLQSVPTDGNDLLLVLVLGATGALVGLASGAATRVRVLGQHAYVKAGFVAAALWVAGAGTRLAFQLYATNGGGPSVARFSEQHDITSDQAWVAALVIMALAEVVVRLTVIVVRARRGLASAAVPAEAVTTRAAAPVLA